MRSDYISDDTISHLLWALTPADKLICEIALETGWRISDILELKTMDIIKALSKKRTSLTIIEQKTNKKSTKYINRALLERVKEQAGIYYCFEHRDSMERHRTRQAVYQDIKRVAKKFGIKTNFSPHSLRKNYAVYMYKHYGIAKTQKALNHEDIIVTMLYAFSNELKKQKM